MPTSRSPGAAAHDGRLRLNGCATSTFANGSLAIRIRTGRRSLANTFSIGRNFEVSVLLDGRFGNDVANFTRRITEFFGADKSLEKERAVTRCR